jgi:DNA-binding transcriptional LysR family regulator
LDRFKPNIEPIWLVYPQTRHLTPTVRAFVDFMAAQFRPSRQPKS